MNISIDEGALVLITEILRQERGQPELTCEDAAKAIVAAINRLRPTSAVLKAD